MAYKCANFTQFSMLKLAILLIYTNRYFY